MNEFFLYKQICDIENIASQYKSGQKIYPEIQKIAEEISTRKYMVAVVGEFNRGKSSLINALIGANVLPTDVLPATSTVMRLVYGDKKRFIVYYRDGLNEEHSLSALQEFVCKSGEQQEKKANSIREIVITYPSLLCKSHIEFLDTPGMNDNQSMSEITLGVIDKVDVAIVVISAEDPLSMSERDLICNLIKQSEIRHIIFVTTFLDRIASEKEKNRILAFIEDRIKDDVLLKAKELFADNMILLKKAESILENPSVFGVSSSQALNGFTTDNIDMIEESRIPGFKEELLAILIAAQSSDLPAKFTSIVNRVAKDLPQWSEEELNRIQMALTQIDIQMQYVEQSEGRLESLFRKMDYSLLQYGFSPDESLCDGKYDALMLGSFISGLSSITVDQYSNEQIRMTVWRAAEQVESMFLDVENNLKDKISGEMGIVETSFSELREQAGLESIELENSLSKWTHQFPSLSIEREELLPEGELEGINIIPGIRNTLNIAMKNFLTNVNRYIGAWRVVLFRQNQEDKKRWSPDYWNEKKEALHAERIALQWNFTRHMQKVNGIQDALKNADMSLSVGITV